MNSLANDKAILQELAKYQLELAHSKENLDIKKEWFRHHNFETGRPMVHIELWTFEKDIIPSKLQCTSAFGRRIEADLYRQIINRELFKDDRVVPDYFPILWDTHFNLFDIKVDVTTSSNDQGSSLGHMFNHVITNPAKDLLQLRPSTFGVNKDATLMYQTIVEETIGHILPTKIEMNALSSVPTQKIVHLMGMEAMFLAMYDIPDLFKEMMDRVAKDYLKYFDWLSKESLMLTTTGNEQLGQGSFCFNKVLPSTSGQLTSKDVWGHMDSQESVGVSVDMYKEFIFPAYEKIANQFGLLSYGCCEPVESIWEPCLSRLENLRKVSISPWCDETYMGRQLKDKSIIYHRKPSPNYLGINSAFDEEAFRTHIKDTVLAAKGCQLEFTQRDVYTLQGNIGKVKRSVEIIREEYSR